ncbi:WYL domain-containing protein [Rhabdobacter roseus]|nr:WYL domain-containing protein [Rhabdobacter roseus]
MPISLNKLGRLKVIHQRLSSSRRYSWQQLAYECQLALALERLPSRRTILDDVRYLREVGAPIPESQSHYFYERSFPLFDVLNPQEALLLHETLGLLRQIKGISAFAELEQLAMPRKDYPTGEQATACIVHFEENAHYEGREHLGPLRRCIASKTPLTITYQDFTNQRFQFRFHPYLLKEYNNRWYLFGLDEASGELYNLALDRIRSFEPQQAGTYRPNSRWDFDALFSTIVGVTRPALREPERIVLRVYGERANYVLTKPIHAHQQLLDETDDYVDLEYWLIPNPELTACILELGPDAEVLLPLSLRAELAALARQLVERYEGPSPLCE